MEAIIEALANGGGDKSRRAAQLEAALKISSLKTRQRLNLAEKGVIGTLINFLVRSHGGDDDECVEASLFALLALASGSERFVELRTYFIDDSFYVIYIYIHKHMEDIILEYTL